MSIVNKLDVSKIVKLQGFISDIHRRLGPPPNWQREEGFESLVKIILEQQVSLASAHAHFKTLKSRTKTITPKYILSLSDQTFRDRSISRQKTNYLRALSLKILNGDLDLVGLKYLSEQEAREKLTSVKGIGNWTADIYLMQCLKKKDIFPSGDIAVIRTMEEFVGLTDQDEIHKYSEKWRPLRTLATYYLWHHYLDKKGLSLSI